MTNHGDDCYFFYYSTCSKGDSCPFRHCEAAMGNETVCNLWQEGRCFRTVCKFRHMEITKNRKEISCYWEKQPAGCQKPHCAFFHERPRFIEGVFVPLDKSVSRNEEQGPEEVAAPPPPPAVAAAALPTTANPQLRGFIKTETQELVPSPTHPPVVINPADDDEDEDDQISEEGEDAKGGPSPRKHSKPGDSLNFGVSTLEEIRLRRALKASMKRAGYPLQGTQTSTNGEKENIQAFLQPALLEQREEEGRRSHVAQRLGRKLAYGDVNGADGLALKRSLAERLGRVVDSDQSPFPPQKSSKPVRERLGLFSASASSPPVGSPEVPTKAPEQIRIKTLEEIRREKATKSQQQSDIPLPAAAETVPVQVPSCIKRTAAVKEAPTRHITTFSEFIQEKKKRQDEEHEQCSNSKKAKLSAERIPAQSAAESEGAETAGKVKVKTLEEIRKEKAVRIWRTTEVENTKTLDSEDASTKRRTLQRTRKPATQDNVPMEQEVAVMQKAAKVAAGGSETNDVKVKSFEEIMREKRLRKQEQEEQAKSLAAEEAPQASARPTAAAGSQKRKLPVRGHGTPPPSSNPSISLAPDSRVSRARVPTQKKLSIKAKMASKLDNGSIAAAAAAPLDEGLEQQELESHHRNTTRCSAPSRAGEETPPSGLRQRSRCPGDTKVRPKLNVKPSIMKPAVQVKPAQKKRAAEASAVAAVKPLTSSSSAPEEKEAAHRDLQARTSRNGEDRPSSTSSQSGTSNSATLKEVCPTPDLVNLSPGKENCPATKNPVLKTPPQPRTRRSSMANRTTSTGSSCNVSAAAVDDFDELINEFTDDHLEEDMDPSIGEDDLLQELSEMIDS